MAYEGEHLYQCNRVPYPWHLANVVVVSGAKWNPCGHTLLNAGGAGLGGHYFHIAGDGYAKPYYMDHAGYLRYLRESAKQEIRRQWIPLPNPAGAQARLDYLATKPWLWGVAAHNCATFGESILAAGGSDRGLYSNCPKLEKF